MLGISVYPEKADKKEILEYIDLANEYGFKRIFTCLLSAPKDIEKIKKDFKEIITHGRNYGMEVILDVSPHVFNDLNINYDDLKFFSELNATGIRLDMGFDGKIEANMTNNPYDLKIELNMSSCTNYVNLIMDYNPKKSNLIGCHNFYPQKYSGLSLEHFIKCSEKFKELNLRTAAFVTSQVGLEGPWEVTQGLPTLEMHRNLAVDTQVKHMYQIGLIDDIIISNQFASKEELEKISKIKENVLKFKIKLIDNLDDLSKKIIFDDEHIYRGDINDYAVRTSETRVKYKNETIKPQNQEKILKRGTVVICNDSFGQYKAELQIIKKEIIDDELQRNVVGFIEEDELFLLDTLKPWQKFSFEECNENIKK